MAQKADVDHQVWHGKHEVGGADDDPFGGEDGDAEYHRGRQAHGTVVIIRWALYGMCMPTHGMPKNEWGRNSAQQPTPNWVVARKAMPARSRFYVLMPAAPG